jgi:hypothetical protein
MCRVPQVRGPHGQVFVHVVEILRIWGLGIRTKPEYLSLLVRLLFQILQRRQRLVRHIPLP